MSKIVIFVIVTMALVGTLVWYRNRKTPPPAAQSESFTVTKTDEQWKADLSPAAYRVLRHEATEPANSSALNQEKREGVFTCQGCQNELFDSQTKFDSGTGWPSFYRPKESDSVATRSDRSLLMARTEVHCARCGGHLGHVFNDGPAPTGKRYCMNGDALGFTPQTERSAETNE